MTPLLADRPAAPAARSALRQLARAQGVVRDYVETPAGIRADLRVSKLRPRDAPAAYGFWSSIRPVSAWPPTSPIRTATPGAVCTTAGTPLEGGLALDSIDDIVARASERAGIEIRFTGHSPRCGLATFSRLKGHHRIVNAEQGGWPPLQDPCRPPRSG
ncbi:hypothetical protein [Streptomyces murinus]|uniref:hypothetical protein n=1 Tax=Streptomyces murinus TaxID=33900 RepID=UPI003F446A82